MHCAPLAPTARCVHKLAVHGDRSHPPARAQVLGPLLGDLQGAAVAHSPGCCGRCCCCCCRCCVPRPGGPADPLRNAADLISGHALALRPAALCGASVASTCFDCAICGAAQPPQASTAAGGAGKLGCGGMRHGLGALHGPLRAVAHESGCCGAQMPLGGATLTWSDALGTHQVAAPASVLPPRARAPRQSFSVPRAYARGCNALFRRGRHCRHRQNASCSFAWRAPSPVGQAAPRSAHEADGALHVSSVHQLTSPPFPLLSCACAEGRSVARGACSTEVPQEGECGAEQGARQRRARRRPNRIRSAWRAVSRERVRACARGWAAAVAGESAA